MHKHRLSRMQVKPETWLQRPPQQQPMLRCQQHIGLVVRIYFPLTW